MLGEWFGESVLTWPDYCVFFVFLAALLWIGFRCGGGEASTGEFFLGGRRIPWWAACLSFVATEISAMTIVGVPATAYRENWQYAQFFIGSAAARVAIAYLFIPAFYRYDCTTIYEFLRHRFGPMTQYTAVCFFFVTRLLASGVRLMAACLAVSVLLGWHLIAVIFIFTVVSILYIGYGGIRAVVFNGVFQAVTFTVAGIATLFFIHSQLEGGVLVAMETAGRAGRLDLWNLGPSLSEPAYFQKFFKDPNILWVAILNGFFGSMAAFGTDHELMQRLLTVRTRRDSQRTMLLTILGSFLVLVLFLSVGTGLYVFYAQNPGWTLPDKLDKIYPHFATQAMPGLLRGLVLSAIVMASIDSPLASLTASFVTDIYKPLILPKAPEKHYLRLSRVCVLIFGALLGAVAYFFSFFDRMLWLAFKVGGITFGSLLGVFLLGLLTRCPANRANLFAMSFMALANFVLLLLSESGMISLGWSWLVVLGTVGTFALGWALTPWLDGGHGKEVAKG